MESCVQGYWNLGLRDGAKEALEILERGDFRVWCFTSGDKERVRGYFDRGGITPAPEIISCDGSGVSKPALLAYQAVLKEIPDEDEKWFAAAHHWDVSAAVRCGFRGAFCTEYEGEGLWGIFGSEMDVVGDSLPEMARKVVAASSS